MAEPSKVIHVRNVGHEISENDLLQLFQPFGVITKLVMLRAKNQALVQMQDVASAINVLQFYATVQPSIRGRNVYVQFSSHQELTTMDQNTQGRGDEVFKPLSSMKRAKVRSTQESYFRGAIFMMVAVSWIFNIQILKNCKYTTTMIGQGISQIRPCPQNQKAGLLSLVM